MRWFVDKRLDSKEAFCERLKFYEILVKKNLFIADGTGKCFEFTDRGNDNRCMIIGHTDAAEEVFLELRKKSQKRYKFFLSVCEMAGGVFEKWQECLKCEIYYTAQVLIEVNGKRILTVEFLEPRHTKLMFKATRSEISMYHSKHKGFINKLETSFEKQK